MTDTTTHTTDPATIDSAAGAAADRQERQVEQISHVVVRFAGDSGDGMQLTGDRFTSASALFGNDLSTFPDYPAEIRAPAGTVNGVSSFQVHISDHDITTPGDAPNVLVAMNPAALKADLHRLEQNGLLIVNSDAFETRDLEKAGYDHNPLHDRQGEFRHVEAEGKPAGPAGRPAEVQAGVLERRLPAQGHRVVDDGSRRAGRPVVARVDRGLNRDEVLLNSRF